MTGKGWDELESAEYQYITKIIEEANFLETILHIKVKKLRKHTISYLI